MNGPGPGPRPKFAPVPDLYSNFLLRVGCHYVCMYFTCCVIERMDLFWGITTWECQRHACELKMNDTWYIALPAMETINAIFWCDYLGELYFVCLHFTWPLPQTLQPHFNAYEFSNQGEAKRASVSCVYFFHNYVPFLPCFCYALKCGCRVKTIPRSAKILENARALAGPFRTIAFIVSIGGRCKDLATNFAIHIYMGPCVCKSTPISINCLVINCSEHSHSKKRSEITTDPRIELISAIPRIKYWQQESRTTGLLKRGQEVAARIADHITRVVCMCLSVGCAMSDTCRESAT